MKQTCLAFLLGLIALALSGCVYDGGYGPGYPNHPNRPLPPPGGNLAGDYYQRGLSQGSSDARKGLANNPGRYLSSVPRPYRNDFSRGYEAGYRNNHRPGGGWGGSGGSWGGSGGSHADPFYDQGRGWGDHDRTKGFSYMPSRYYKKVPVQSRDAFNRGYARGYGR